MKKLTSIKTTTIKRTNMKLYGKDIQTNMKEAKEIQTSNMNTK